MSLRFLLFLLSLLFISWSSAKARILPKDNTSLPEPQKSYATPNEQNPQQGRAIYQMAPEGVYVSVGTERGLIGFAFAEKTSHLLLVDWDRNVVLYNRININLLKMAESPQHLLWLRTEAMHAEWKTVIKDSPYLTHEEKRYLRRKAIFEYWNSQRSNVYMRQFHQDFSQNKLNAPFRKANYLFNQKMFVRLQEAARNGRIEVTQASIASIQFIRQLKDSLTKLGLKVAVLDVSNGWWKRYISRKQFRRMVLSFSEASHKESLLVMTDTGFRTGFRDSILETYSWNYFALTFGAAEQIHAKCWATKIFRFVSTFWKIGVNGVPTAITPKSMRGSQCQQSVGS